MQVNHCLKKVRMNIIGDTTSFFMTLGSWCARANIITHHKCKPFGQLQS